MDILGDMARSTRCVIATEGLILVTRLTRRNGMKTQQGKSRQVVIE